MQTAKGMQLVNTWSHPTGRASAFGWHLLYCVANWAKKAKQADCRSSTDCQRRINVHYIIISSFLPSQRGLSQAPNTAGDLRPNKIQKNCKRAEIQTPPKVYLFVPRSAIFEMTGLEGIGAASGLASLFNTAVAPFDYILVAKQAASRLQSLLVQLDNAQLRLTRWGKAAGITGFKVEDENSMKRSGSFQLDETQEKQAIKTFLAVSKLFEECQKLCRAERKKDSSPSTNEIVPFDPASGDWSLEHRYLHQQMQGIVNNRRNKVSVAQRVKFAFYQKKHLENFIKDIDCHSDNLYRIYDPPAEDLVKLGKAELTEILEIVEKLGDASKNDRILSSAAEAILKQKASGRLIDMQLNSYR